MPRAVVISANIPLPYLEQPSRPASANSIAEAGREKERAPRPSQTDAGPLFDGKVMSTPVLLFDHNVALLDRGAMADDECVVARVGPLTSLSTDGQIP